MVKNWWPWKSRPVNDPVYLEYARGFKQRISARSLIRDLSFTVLDTETTGLNLKKDRILSIAAVKVKQFELHTDKRLLAYVNCADYQPGKSVEIHGILNKHLRKGKTEKELLHQLLPYLGTDIIVGHHIGFDITMLNKACLREYGAKLLNRTLDTAALAKKYDPASFYYDKGKAGNLDELCKKFKIPLGKRHTAEGDTYITALLFLKLIGRLEQKGKKRLMDL
ncbi:MAG: exonuclease domain-containing protein [Bacteroidota bacterium]